MSKISGLLPWFFGILLVLAGIEPSFAQAQMAPVTIHGASYFSIGTLSRDKGFEYQWDPFLKNATVTSASGFIKFHVDSEFILNRNGLIKLSDKVLYFQGEVMAPWSANEYLEAISNVVGLSTAGQTSQEAVVLSPVPTHRIKRVVIDAGHGGYDLGAVSPGGIKEKELTLKVAKMVANEIRQTSVEVIMTRSDDTFIPLAARSSIANDNEADFFISIHANATSSKSTNGFEVYYLSEAVDDMAVALEQAENVSLPGKARTMEPTKNLKAIYLDLQAAENRKESLRAASLIADRVQQSVDIGARRIKSAQFHVLKWTQAPSLLIEIGYLSNTEDELKLADPIYEKRLAKAIVSGFMNYKMEFEQTNGFTQ